MGDTNGFRDYSDFTVERLRLPINQKEYLIPEIGAADKLIINLAAEGDEDALAKINDGDTLRRMLLGSALDQMLADNVPDGAIDRAELTALAEVKHGRIGAMQAWELGQDPEALAAVLAATQAILAIP